MSSIWRNIQKYMWSSHTSTIEALCEYSCLRSKRYVIVWLTMSPSNWMAKYVSSNLIFSPKQFLGLRIWATPFLLTLIPPLSPNALQKKLQVSVSAFLFCPRCLQSFGHRSSTLHLSGIVSPFRVRCRRMYSVCSYFRTHTHIALSPD